MKPPKFTKDKVWETIAVMLFGFSVIIFLTENVLLQKGLIIANIVIGLATIISFSLGKLIVKAWWKMAEIIGAVMSRVLLSVVFFLFLTPIALLYRIFNRIETNKGWVERNHKFEGELFGKVW